MYGPYGAFAPYFDSSFATLTRMDSSLLYSVYGDDMGVTYAHRFVYASCSVSLCVTVCTCVCSVKWHPTVAMQWKGYNTTVQKIGPCGINVLYMCVVYDHCLH